jgi:hypothetical protein
MIDEFHTGHEGVRSTLNQLHQISVLWVMGHLQLQSVLDNLRVGVRLRKRKVHSVVIELKLNLEDQREVVSHSWFFLAWGRFTLMKAGFISFVVKV